MAVRTTAKKAAAKQPKQSTTKTVKRVTQRGASDKHHMRTETANSLSKATSATTTTKQINKDSHVQPSRAATRHVHFAGSVSPASGEASIPQAPAPAATRVAASVRERKRRMRRQARHTSEDSDIEVSSLPVSDEDESAQQHEDEDYSNSSSSSSDEDDSVHDDEEGEDYSSSDEEHTHVIKTDRMASTQKAHSNGRTLIPAGRRSAALASSSSSSSSSAKDAAGYEVLCLRFLPPQFEEPQLYQFLGQFGSEVLNCFCVRSRRTHQSKGIAYVQMDNVDILDTLVEECHGMLLGGRAVQARRALLHRPMPSKEQVMRRRRLAYAYQTKGAPLKQHSVMNKDSVALLIKAARTERQNNTYLQSMHIDFACHDFARQLQSIPRHLLTRKIRGVGPRIVPQATSTREKEDEEKNEEVMKRDAEEATQQTSVAVEEQSRHDDEAVEVGHAATPVSSSNKRAAKKTVVRGRARASLPRKRAGGCDEQTSEAAMTSGSEVSEHVEHVQEKQKEEGAAAEAEVKVAEEQADVQVQHTQASPPKSRRVAQSRAKPAEAKSKAAPKRRAAAASKATTKTTTRAKKAPATRRSK